jgi:hypothetical protein
MNGKELADRLFAAFAQGTPGDDPALVDEMAKEISGLSTDETWRFVFAAGTKDRGSADLETFRTFNVAIARRDEFKRAISAMHAAPRPADLPQPTA